MHNDCADAVGLLVQVSEWEWDGNVVEAYSAFENTEEVQVVETHHPIETSISRNIK